MEKKNVKDLTNDEIKQQIKMLEILNSDYAQSLQEVLQRELNSREKAERLAKEEAKRKAEEGKRKAEQERLLKEKELRSNQHDILGKCFKLTDSTKQTWYYEVYGVVNEYAYVNKIGAKDTEYYDYTFVNNVIPLKFFINNKSLTQVTREEFNEVKHKMEYERNKLERMMLNDECRCGCDCRNEDCEKCESELDNLLENYVDKVIRDLFKPSVFDNFLKFVF